MKPITILAIYVICAATLMSGCVEDIARQTVHEGTFEVGAMGSYYFAARSDGEWTMEYEISSSQPVTIYAMTMRNYNLKEAGRPYHCTSKYTDVYTMADSCIMGGDAVFLIENNNWMSDARVYVKVDGVKW